MGTTTSTSQLINKLSSLNIKIWSEARNLRYKAPRGALTEELKQEIIANKEALIAALEANYDISSTHIQIDQEHRYESFPLTDLQEAYWVGEKNFYQMQAVPYFYHEYEVEDLDIDRFQYAVNALVERHEVLRTAIQDNGVQVIQAQVPEYKVEYNDIAHLSQNQIAEVLKTKRNTIEACLPTLDAGQPFYFCIHRLTDCFRLHLVFRLTAVDGLSLVILYNDLIKFYLQNNYSPKRLNLSYRDYVLAIEAYKQTAAYQKSLQYWQNRIDTLPPAPDLPTQNGLDANPGYCRFSRLSGRISRERWVLLQEQARQHALSISMLLCTIYAETLRLWSKSKAFTLNVLSTNRVAVDPEMQYLVGNCSTTSLLEVANTKGSFAKRAREIQKQMYLDLEHSCVSGVSVIRELFRSKGGTHQPLMPIVFTSGLEVTKELNSFPISADGWSYVNGSLKTPQVWLDHQLYEENGELVLNWDFTPDVFPGEMIHDMFHHYQAYINALAVDPSLWNAELPFSIANYHLTARERANATDKELPQGLLQSFFNQQVKINGDRAAIITKQHQLTYREVYEWSMTICKQLQSSRVKPNDVVGVLVERGWKQIVAVLGVLQAGAAYLPLDTKLPPARINYILQHSGATAVVTDNSLFNHCQFSADTQVIGIPAQPDPASALVKPESLQLPSDTAYVIYTSGSTGNPKGVVIDHTGAVNTIQDMIAKFDLNQTDRVIALSAINFDLSVFDIFGTLAVGAALVIPEDDGMPDPKNWVECLVKAGVTVWNSVPALLEMTLESLGDQQAAILNQLRLVLLSGDWIPLSLVERFKAINSTASLIGLGGATEASIWSNFFTIEQLDPSWRSVPYGFALSNQQLHVLDDYLEPTPIWAVGDIYISGKGLAKGYLNDSEKTTTSFITHPKTGTSLYKTGDLGRSLPGGEIEFLGRKDYQVKVRGFRIELGEIEAKLTHHPAIKSAIALVHSTNSREQNLVAFITCNDTTSIGNEELKRYLAEILPAYMVPTIIVQLDRLPLSANGKIDRKALVANIATYMLPTKTHVLPRNDVENTLAGIWSNLLNVASISVEENFFQLGGNSLLAVRLINEIDRQFKRSLPLSSLMHDNTIAAQAKLITKLEEKAVSPLVLIRGGNQAKTPLFLVHPVGGNILCYEKFVGLLNSKIRLYGLQCTPDYEEAHLSSYIEKISSAYVTEILKAYPEGVIHLGGWSMGGVICCEIATQLREKGRSIGRIFMIDSWVGLDGQEIRFDHATAVTGFFRDLVGGAMPHELTEKIQNLPEAEQLNQGIELLKKGKRINTSIQATYIQTLFKAYLNNSEALQLYRAKAIPFEIDFFKARNLEQQNFPGLVPFIDPNHGWLQYVDACNIREFDANHYSIMVGDVIKQIAVHINRRIHCL